MGSLGLGVFVLAGAARPSFRTGKYEADVYMDTRATLDTFFHSRLPERNRPGIEILGRRDSRLLDALAAQHADTPSGGMSRYGPIRTGPTPSLVSQDVHVTAAVFVWAARL